MSSFTASLLNAFKRDNFRAYWVLKLYYGDETNFTGISDLPRARGGDLYYGLELDWEGLSRSGDIDQFIVSDNTLPIKIDNTLNSIEGVRFSDLYNSRQYANRKWQLIQADENATFSDTNIIASGIISDKTPKHDELTCNIYLDDWWNKYNIEFPISKALISNYPNLPDNNKNKPKPHSYGNLLRTPTEAWHQNPEFTKTKFPALIVDGWEDDNTGVTVAIDNQTIDNFKNLFLYKSNQWIYLDDTPTENLPEVSFLGSTWKTYYQLSAHDDPHRYGTGSGTLANYEDGFDLEPVSFLEWDFISKEAELKFRLADTTYNKLGSTLKKVYIKLFCDIVHSPTINTVILVGVTFNDATTDQLSVAVNNGENIYDITSFFNSDQLESWNLDIEYISLNYTDNVTPIDVEWDIKEIGIELEFAPEKFYTKYIDVLENDLILDRKNVNYLGNRLGQFSIRTTQIGDIDLVYVSGAFRTYGSWITGRGTGYLSGDVIENPVYMIEDIVRNIETKLGLSAGTLVNTTIFDIAGNKSDGTLGNALNDAVADIKFAFSQFKLINAKDLIRNICRLSGLYFYWGADGKAVVRARNQSFTSADRVIDFSEIAYPSEKNKIPLPSAKWTPLTDVANSITVKFLYDYGNNQSIESLDPEDYPLLEDLTSQGDGANGYKQILGEEINAQYVLDLTTALNIGKSKLSFKKDRKRGFKCQFKKPTHNDAQFGEIVSITNFPSTFQIFGETITDSTPWMIVIFDKKPAFPKFTFIRVPGSV